MLTDEQVTKIEHGNYGDGWRLDLCADWREWQRKVAQLTAERDKYLSICDKMNSEILLLRADLDAARQAAGWEARKE